MQNQADPPDPPDRDKLICTPRMKVKVIKFSNFQLENSIQIEIKTNLKVLKQLEVQSLNSKFERSPLKDLSV